MKYEVGKCYPKGEEVCAYLEKVEDCLPEYTAGICTYDLRLERCRKLLTPVVLPPVKEEL